MVGVLVVMTELKIEFMDYLKSYFQDFLNNQNFFLKMNIAGVL